MCACGSPEREGMDHSPHVCCRTGFWSPEDIDAINENATIERNTDAQHRR